MPTTSKANSSLVVFVLACLVPVLSWCQSGDFAAVLDNGQPGTSSAGGTWKISSGRDPYGADSLYTSRTGATYTFQVILPQAGSYEVYLWWTENDNRRTDVPVDILHASGRISVTVNQRLDGGQWNRIGALSFGTTATVTILSLGNGTTCADALGFVAVAGGVNQTPSAFIDTVEPRTTIRGETIRFSGHGDDSDGTIVAQRWRSSLDGEISSAASFSSTSLSVGTHGILFSVQDDQGAWSSEVEVTVLVNPLPGPQTELILDNGAPGTSSAGGTWSISGGKDPYGADSLYTSKAGATYTFQLPLPQAGLYEVHLWWTRTSNRRPDVPVDIVHALGASTVTVNQLENAGKWNLAGVWNFADTAAITIHSRGNGTTCADAVRLVLASAPNQPPLALIQSIAPNPATEGDAVSFSGQGDDPDGTVAAYLWTSSLQGQLSNQAFFTSTTLILGFHTISFRVQDDLGVWSGEARAQLQVNRRQGGPSGGGDAFLTDVHTLIISPSLVEVRFDTTARLKGAIITGAPDSPAAALDPDYLSYHSLYLRNLQPDTTSTFHIELSSRDGTTYTSSPYTITTSASQDFSVRAEHPRILLRPEDIPLLQAKIQGDFATEWTQIENGCNSLLSKTPAAIYASGSHHYNSDAPALCINFLLTGDAAYANKAIDLARHVFALNLGPRDAVTKGIPIVAPVYDCLFNYLTDADRQSLGRDLYALTKSVYDDQVLEIENIEGHTVEAQAMLLYGSLAVYEDQDQDTVQLFTDVLRNYYYLFLPSKRFFIGVDGGAANGWWYAAYSRDFPFLLATLALETASAQPLDLFAQESSWMSRYSRWYLYGLRGDRSFFRKNDTSSTYEFQNRNYLALRALAARTGDRHAQWLATYLHESTKTGTYSSMVLKKVQYVYDLLFHDKSVPAEPPSLPLSQWFRKQGVVMMRESWNPETVVAQFVSSPYFTGGHQHLDDLSFAMYYHGGQAIDGGLYDKFGSLHHRNYYRRTIAHNSLTIFDPGEDYCNSVGSGSFDCTGEAVLSNDGGQKIQPIVAPFGYIPRHVDDLVNPQSPFLRGGIAIYEDTGEYTYALGRGGPSYASDKVSLVDRHFLWIKRVQDLKHPLVVVFDNVEGKSAEHVKAYHLHTRNEVAVDGTTVIGTNTNRITGDAGVLYNTILLPRDPLITVHAGEAVFEVDGVSYPPTDRTSDSTTSIAELEQCRLAVSPRTQSLTDQFLNIIYVTDAGGEGNPPSTLLTAEGMYGVCVQNWIVLFGLKELSLERTAYTVLGPASHLLLGMKDDLSFDVYVGGELHASLRSSREGTLRFDLAVGGEVEVRRN